MRRRDREVTDRNELEEILKQCRVCHVAMVDEGWPYVIPLSYGYRLLGNGTLELYFHSAQEGRKLDILRKSSRVCFEISAEISLITADKPCNYGCSYISLIGNGEAVFLKNPEEKCRALSCMFEHQAGEKAEFTSKQSEAVCVWKIVSRDYAGKKKLN